MAYKDEHGGHDSAETLEQNHGYVSEETQSESQSLTQEQKTSVDKMSKQTSTESASQQSQPKGLMSRLRSMLFGEETAGSKAKRGFLNWRMDTGAGGGSAAPANMAVKILTKLGTPKILAAILMSSGIGVFSILGIFTTYKNDGAVRNEPPLRCEQGVVELPSAGGEDDEERDRAIAVLRDLFVEEFNFSDEAVIGMLACMQVESNIKPNRLESDYILTSAKAEFDSVAGPGTTPDSQSAKEAYWTYGDSFQSGGGWNGNSGGYILDGHMCCGVGLIQWTKGRGVKLFDGLDIVGNTVSPMDIEYQAAFLLAEMKSDSYSAKCSPDGSPLASATSAEEACEIFFTTMVSGGLAGDLLQERIGKIAEVRADYERVAANSEFRSDILSMAELLADDSFSGAVAKSNKIQLCLNHTYVSTADIANAAVSISWLERGEYEDVHGAYGMYRRAARSPVIINDWNWVDGIDGGDGPGTPISDGTYGSHWGTEAGVKADQAYYTNKGAPGKLDLIACTEYYYFAHMMAFPKETGKDSSHAGYFSSCDRGTATAVRIAGADDKFPAGNPLAQLQWAAGGAKINAQHNPDRRGREGAGFLWQFAGFLRGCDYYSASGSSSISPGTVMISWNVKAANGMLKEAMMGGATAGGVGDEGGVVEGAEADESSDDWDPEDFDEDAEMTKANLRWPLAVTNTTRHIITFVGEGTVQKFWGMEWLYQQWTLFDDTDSLIRGDLTIDVPEIMRAGLTFKGKTAKMATDQKATFYEQEMEGAKDTKDVKGADFTEREMSFNAKTGLPTFHSWEQIFVRLIHNSDDDAAAKTAEEKDLYNEFSVDEDNYLDDAADPDRIEQYQAWNTYADKWFFEDWNSVGGGEVEGDGAEDYKGFASTELTYNDPADDKWTKAAAIGVSSNPFWRYELITDIEYRANQLLRFGMASFMCNLPSEEDADVYQSGVEGNDTGHIIGNLYRRYSRIPNETDVSGRYYYFNTVVSNDMLQDLLQLWTHDRNGDKDGAQGGGDYKARNFGPMYLFSTVGEGMDAYPSTMRSRTTGILDRRYGISANDVKNIMEGLGGLGMGTGADAVNEYLGKMLAMPMHQMSDAQIALYARERDSDDEAYTDERGAHESNHLYSEEEWYEDDIYGVNPFLMLESENGIARLYPNYLLMNPGQEDWSASGGKGESVRKDLDTPVKEGVDGSDDKEDDRLAWIDRHYVYGANGNINMLAYQVAGLNPSVGKRRDESVMSYEDWLKSVKTLDATETPSTGDNSGQEDADNLFGSWGEVRYTDFIYGEDKLNNQRMAKRLFGTDHRQDGEGITAVRDDYNRREYIVIPYYHTHAQMCDHSHLRPYTHYNENITCKWWNDSWDTTDPDTKMIDTQTWLNTGNIAGGGSCPTGWWEVSGDQGDTVSFTEDVQNRGKYDMSQLVSWNNAQANVMYYTANGVKIDPNEKPRIHVTCNGWQQECCEGGSECYTCGTEDPDTGEIIPADCSGGCTCCGEICHACNQPIICGEPHDHPCDECLASDYCHDHKECDSQLHRNYPPDGDPCMCNQPMGSDHHADHGMTDSGSGHYTGPSFSGETDDCHDLYGCNILEFLYHNPDEMYGGKKVEAIYMVIPVVEKPIEKWGDHGTGDIGIEDFMVGGKVVPDKANLLQKVYHNDDNGLVDKNWDAMTGDHLQALAKPFTSGGTYLSTATVKYINIGDAQWTEGMGVDRPIGRNDSGAWGGGKTLFGIFTIEGNIIREKKSEEQCETIRTTDDNCEVKDFQRLESTRNRVGIGKDLTQKVNGTGVPIHQNMHVAYGSGLGRLTFDTSSHGEPGFESGSQYGYGEVLITGTQHQLDPTPSQGAYGWTQLGGSGPDGSKGNAKNLFGNSLLREILGDEHVQHVRFGSQNIDGLQDETIDNGRDFMYYANTSRWSEHLDGHGYDKETNPEYYEASFFQKPDQACPGCGKTIIPTDLTGSTNWLAYPSNSNSAGINDDTGKPTGVGGEFRDLDEDRLYLDPYNNVPTDKRFYDTLKRAVTDDPKNDLGEPNHKNKKLIPHGENITPADATVQRGQISNDGNDPKHDGVENHGGAGDGDYNLWVTHASRGTRGMMTQYLNFKGFFHDASSGEEDEKAFMYMLFTVIKRTGNNETTDDHQTKNTEPVTKNDASDGKTYPLKTVGYKGRSDGDNDLKEDFAYSGMPGDAVEVSPSRVWGIGSVEIKDENGEIIGYKPANFSDTYGQGNNSHWKALIDIYNAAMGETRHFD